MRSQRPWGAPERRPVLRDPAGYICLEPGKPHRMDRVRDCADANLGIVLLMPR
jgi:hypothetical protein